MTDLTWNPSYETGHARVDLEHRVFVDLIATMAAQAKAGAHGDTLRRTVVEIYKYADFHFFSEESMMLEAKYPDYAHHRQLHQTLLADLRPFVEAVCVDELAVEAMVEFLRKWFISHTLHEDLKLANYVDDHGLAQTASPS